MNVGDWEHVRVVFDTSKLQWTPIPIGLGLAFISYQHFNRVRRRELESIENSNIRTPAPSWMVSALRALPLRAFSRFYGWINEFTLPVCLRRPVFMTWTKLFNCDLSEMAAPDLTSYKNLQEFFTRSLRPEVRPVHDNALLVSPADSTVLYCGTADSNTYCVEQIKGVTYRLDDFLGSDNMPPSLTAKAIEEGGDCIKGKSNTVVHHIILYLAPGDYHWFHSPAKWLVTLRRHIPGDLLSVAPALVKLIEGLFVFNERAVLTGIWEHGYFAMALVGATNVGSIIIDGDPNLLTNQRAIEDVKDHVYAQPIEYKKGDRVGGFRMGSTVVLVFEAPSDFAFSVSAGDKIKFGQHMGDLIDKANVKSSAAA